MFYSSFQALVKPLKALCDFQIGFGALKHQSKQYLINNGLYKWQNPKKDPLFKAQMSSGNLTEHCQSIGNNTKNILNEHHTDMKNLVSSNKDIIDNKTENDINAVR